MFESVELGQASIGKLSSMCCVVGDTPKRHAQSEDCDITLVVNLCVVCESPDVYFSHRAIKYREANWGKSYPEDLTGHLSADRSSEELEFQNEQNKC